MTTVFDDPTWILARKKWRGPVPAPREVIPDAVSRDSYDEKKWSKRWDTWKKTRLLLAENPRDESTLVRTCAAWFDPNLVADRPNLLLSGPFESTWRVSFDLDDDDGDDDGRYRDERDDDEDRGPTIRASCARWETTCVLARVVALDLERTMSTDASRGERKRRAKRIVACSDEAARNLRDWRETGNGKRWGEQSPDAYASLPLEANVAYFEATRDLGSMLHDVACVDAVTDPNMTCDKTFTQVALDIVRRANELVDRVAERAPKIVHDMTRPACDAIVASVAEKIVRAALALKTLQRPCVGWKRVAFWKDRRLKRLENGEIPTVNLVAERAEANTLRQFSRSTILEAHDEPLEPADARDAWGATRPDYSFRPEVLFRT